MRSWRLGGDPRKCVLVLGGEPPTVRLVLGGEPRDDFGVLGLADRDAAVGLVQALAGGGELSERLVAFAGHLEQRLPVLGGELRERLLSLERVLVRPHLDRVDAPPVLRVARRQRPPVLAGPVLDRLLVLRRQALRRRGRLLGARHGRARRRQLGEQGAGSVRPVAAPFQPPAKRLDARVGGRERGVQERDPLLRRDVAPGTGDDAQHALDGLEPVDREALREQLQHRPDRDRLPVVAGPVADRDHEGPAGSQQPGRLVEHRPWPYLVLEHLAEQHGVEGSVREREVVRLGMQEADPPADDVGLGGQPALGLVEHGLGVVDADHGVALPAQEQCRGAITASDIEHVGPLHLRAEPVDAASDRPLRSGIQGALVALGDGVVGHVRCRPSAPRM